MVGQLIQKKWQATPKKKKAMTQIILKNKNHVQKKKKIMSS